MDSACPYADFEETHAKRGKCVWKKGEIIQPMTYKNYNGYKCTAMEDIKVITEKIFPSRKRPVSISRCEIPITSLSRDFDIKGDSAQKINEMNADELWGILKKNCTEHDEIKEGTIAWWHISTEGMPEIIRNYYADKFSLEEKKRDKLSVLAYSRIFCLDYSMPYTTSAHIRVHVPKDVIITAYKKALGIKDVEFRVFGTFRYINEVMYPILVCPSGTTTLGDFPILKDVKQDVLNIKKKDGVYSLKWTPYCTSNLWEGYKLSLMWDHVTFAFYFPPPEFPQPESFSYQVMTDIGFGGILIPTNDQNNPQEIKEHGNDPADEFDSENEPIDNLTSDTGNLRL